jgi:uncharacterized protein YraI
LPCALLALTPTLLLAAIGLALTSTPAYAQTVTPTTTVALTATGAPLPTVALDANGFPTDAEIVTGRQLYMTPSQYQGLKVTFTCVASSFAKDQSGDVAGVNCNDPDDSSALLQVSINSFDVTKINLGDTLRFYGTCQGSFTGTNPFGVQVTVTTVQSTYIDDVTSGYYVNASGVSHAGTTAFTTANTPLPGITLDANGFPTDATAVAAADLYKAPSQYQGQKVTFTCVVSSYAKDQAGDVTAVNCYDPIAGSAMLQVGISSFDVTKINVGDRINFYGTCEGAFTGNNAFGAQITETGVLGTYINDLTSGYQVNAGNPSNGAAQSSTLPPGTAAVTANSTINVRAGPGTAYPIVGQMQAGQELAILAENSDASWWQVNLGTQVGWVSASVVNTSGPVDQVPVATGVPTPPPSPTLAPNLSVPANWKQYQDVSGSFTFSYPPDWTVSKQGTDGVTFSLGGTRFVGVNVTPHPMPGEVGDPDTLNRWAVAALGIAQGPGWTVTQVTTGTASFMSANAVAIFLAHDMDGSAIQGTTIAQIFYEVPLDANHFAVIYYGAPMGYTLTDADRQALATVVASVQAR